MAALIVLVGFVIFVIVFSYFWVLFIQYAVSKYPVLERFETILIFSAPIFLGLLVATTFPIHLLA